jgi:hypothetical protein
LLVPGFRERGELHLPPNVEATGAQVHVRPKGADALARPSRLPCLALPLPDPRRQIGIQVPDALCFAIDSKLQMQKC